MSVEIHHMPQNEYKTGTDHRSHFPMGGMETPYQQDLPRDSRYDVWRQEAADQDQREPVCEAGGEAKAKADDTQSVQGMEEQTTEITEANEMMFSESYEETGVPG